MGIRSIQAIDQSLISIGGWLRTIDAQVISFIRSDNNAWIGQSFYFPQPQQEPDVPEWTYRHHGVSPRKNTGRQAPKWYQYFDFGMPAALWHTSRDWRSPLPGLGLQQKLGASASQPLGRLLSPAYAYPAQQTLWHSGNLSTKRYPFPTVQIPEGLSQFWSTSYQLSTALAVLLPIAVNTVQTSVLTDFRDLVSDGVRLATVNNRTSLTLSAPRPSRETAVQAPVPVRLTLSKPSRKIATTPSYTLPAKGEFTSGYGMRWGRVHRGIDIAGPIGTPIVAAAAGKVVTAGWGDDGFGNKVEIEHPDGTITLYAHASRVLTQVGARVSQGQQIAEIGSSGFSTGPHLHFQIHPGGKAAVDPMFFFGKNRTLTAAKP